jgi:hypothetical protein
MLSGERDLNPPPSVWETDALPDELSPLVLVCRRKRDYQVSYFRFLKNRRKLQ